jgi:hypothetical protein
MNNHRAGTPEENKKHQEATKHMLNAIKSKKAELKTLLRPDLAETYSLCYWDNVGCYWCSDDGINWYVVKCIT